MPEETDSSVFAEDKVYKPAVPLNNKPIAKPKATINSNPIKKNTNKIGSAQTKDFLKEMRSKKKENSKDNDDNIEIFEMNSNMIQEAGKHYFSTLFLSFLSQLFLSPLLLHLLCP